MVGSHSRHNAGTTAPFQPRLVLFDLDGTLVDTLPDLAYCVQRMLRELEQAPAPESEVRQWVGDGIDSLIAHALNRAGNGQITPQDFARARRLFLDFYAQYTCVRSRLYPGVLDALVYLKSRGIALGCVTNKAARFTENLLGGLALRHQFDIVVSGDTLPAKKPSPQPLLYAAEQLQVAVPQCMLVGDSENDVLAAQAAKFRIICVSYGYNRGRNLRELSPDQIIDSFAELPNLIS